MSAAATLGPNARRVLAMGLEGNKRRKVLLAVALYADGGRADPSIRELSERAGIERNVVISVVERLERDGLLKIRHGDNGAGERNRYTLTEGRQ